MPPNLSNVIEGFTLAAQARRLSEHTIADYHNTYHKLQRFLEGNGNPDPLFSEITRGEIEAFLAAQSVSRKTLRNYHTGLSALYTWAVENGYAKVHLLRRIARPQPQMRKIIPFSDAEIHAMLSALTRSKAYINHGTSTSHTLPHAERNKAILVALLDTGLRADELCSLTIADLDTRNLRLHIRAGKGDKERFTPISARTAQIIHKYLTSKRDNLTPDAPLFAVEHGYRMTRHMLLKLVKTIGDRAEVPNVHPHRFRHTFAISYLRNGGDPWTLQDILGHTDMTMVRRYLQLAQSDLSAAHRRASPVANLRI
jgi:integrase/recombinase XerD